MPNPQVGEGNQQRRLGQAASLGGCKACWAAGAEKLLEGLG